MWLAFRPRAGAGRSGLGIPVLVVVVMSSCGGAVDTETAEARARPTASSTVVSTEAPPTTRPPTKATPSSTTTVAPTTTNLAAGESIAGSGSLTIDEFEPMDLTVVGCGEIDDENAVDPTPAGYYLAGYATDPADNLTAVLLVASEGTNHVELTMTTVSSDGDLIGDFRSADNRYSDLEITHEAISTREPLRLRGGGRMHLDVDCVNPGGEPGGAQETLASAIQELVDQAPNERSDAPGTAVVDGDAVDVQVDRCTLTRDGGVLAALEGTVLVAIEATGEGTYTVGVFDEGGAGYIAEDQDVSLVGGRAQAESLILHHIDDESMEITVSLDLPC